MKEGIVTKDVFEKCYEELTSLWSQFPIVEDYKNTLLRKPGYEKWIDSENVDLFMCDNYDFSSKQDIIIEKYYGDDNAQYDVTAEFPQWCIRYFGGYWHDDFVDSE